ncbi:MAG TPA: hypothetical protein VK167_11430 [Flavipsychrobacter sp.]|nr:hypothetical protein [Flavipsychrobacter sp.]
MAKIRTYFIYGILCYVLQSCAVADTSKYQLSSGVYNSKLFKHTAKVYVDVAEDSITVYPIVKNNHSNLADTTQSVSYPTNYSSFQNRYFSKPSFDIDILTMPLKYRPALNGSPNQLNTDFNGALYLGWRNDIYHIKYRKTLFGTYKRKVSHYGFSTGAFCGIGATAINPWVTNNNVAAEYDGAVLLTGVAAIFAVNNLSCGVGVGIDKLMDSNSGFWMYQNKPWVGLLFGLNLN